MAGPVMFMDLMATSERDVELRKTEKLWFSRILEVSPFDMRIVRFRMALDDLVMIFRRAQLPQIWINHMHPNEKLSLGFEKVLTSLRYPAVCSLRRIDDGHGQFETFDGFMYNSRHMTWNNKEQGNIARVVFSQDVANTYQISAQHFLETMIMQLLTQHPLMKRVQVVREVNKPLVVYLNGKMLTFGDNGIYELKENNDVILRIRSMTEKKLK
jgi:hypothetical protein